MPWNIDTSHLCQRNFTNCQMVSLEKRRRQKKRLSFFQNLSCSHYINSFFFPLTEASVLEVEGVHLYPELRMTGKTWGSGLRGSSRYPSIPAYLAWRISSRRQSRGIAKRLAAPHRPPSGAHLLLKAVRVALSWPHEVLARVCFHTWCRADCHRGPFTTMDNSLVVIYFRSLSYHKD